ncbi:DUF6364 family protein [Candidatus Sumerlaeota bacterium]
MGTKLTLRVDERLIQEAKRQAKQRGKSVSRMFAEFVRGLSSQPDPATALPPVTRSLLGAIKDPAAGTIPKNARLE